MKKPVKRVERHHHLQHLVNIAPFVTLIFGIQCYLISQLEIAQNHNDYYLFLGGSLASIIALFIIHDTYYHVDVYEDHLHFHFALLGINKKVYFNDISDVVVPEDAETFSSVMLRLTDGKKQMIYLIDDAQELKSFIEDYQKRQQGLEDITDFAA